MLILYLPLKLFTGGAGVSLLVGWLYILVLTFNIIYRRGWVSLLVEWLYILVLAFNITYRMDWGEFTGGMVVYTGTHL